MRTNDWLVGGSRSRGLGWGLLWPILHLQCCISTEPGMLRSLHPATGRPKETLGATRAARANDYPVAIGGLLGYGMVICQRYSVDEECTSWKNNPVPLNARSVAARLYPGSGSASRLPIRRRRSFIWIAAPRRFSRPATENPREIPGVPAAAAAARAKARASKKPSSSRWQVSFHGSRATPRRAKRT